MYSPTHRIRLGYVAAALCIALLSVTPVMANPLAGGDAQTEDAPADKATQPPTEAADAEASGAEEAPSDKPASADEEPPKQRPYPNLVKELRKIDGVVKAVFANTPRGKNCVFAWFEDKEAAKRWYLSDTHQYMLDMFFPGRIEREPLTFVPDDIGPMMGLACITRSKTGPAIEQISVELYQPLRGGFSANGRFGPDEWKEIHEYKESDIVERKQTDDAEGQDADQDTSEDGEASDSTDSEEMPQEVDNAQR